MHIWDFRVGQRLPTGLKLLAAQGDEEEGSPEAADKYRGAA